MKSFIGMILLAFIFFSPNILAEDTETPYDIVCDDDGSNCKVDQGTFVGWRTFHATCHQCHGQDALGSTFAPSLLQVMQREDMTYERFIDVLENGFQGQLGVMPGWKDDPNVNKRFDELYAYVMARSDGVLGTGRPERQR